MPDEQEMFLIDNGEEQATQEPEENGITKEQAEYQTPDKGNNGKLPAFLAKPVHEDQAAKINDSIHYLYTQDLHLGDDLVLLAKLARTQPDKFDSFLMSFRAEYM